MTTPQNPAMPPEVARFLLLVELCRKLGELGCSSYLVNLAAGGAVLHVDRRTEPPSRLSVAAVERSDGWVYVWEGHCAEVSRLEQLAAHLAGADRP